MANSFGFKDLVDPMPAEQFLRQHWEREPLFVRRGQAAYYDALLSRESIEERISCSGMRYPALRLVREGAYLPVESYTTELRWERDTFHGILQVAKITEEFHRGATVVLQAAHVSWPSLRDLCVEMERSLGHRAHTNVYLAPPNTKGFLPHYDTHEIFVMQITGEKAWQVYKPTVTLPDRSMPYRGERLDLETYGEYTLTPGDMLYFPRGYIHSASTGRLLSLHVTLGVDVYNWLDFMQEALFVARQNPELRRALPTDMLLSDGGGDLKTYAGAIEDMLHMFCRHSTPERVVSSLRRLVACSVLSPHERFSATQPRSSV